MHQAVCPPIAFAATRVRVVPARRASVVSRAWRKEHQVRRDGNDVTHVTHDVDETSILPPGTAFAKARRQLAATCVATCVALAVSGVTPPDATAITSNNLLFLEAWRAVDKAYVDKTFNGVSWFKYRETTVKKTSMDSTEETYEAIKVMLAKLDDPFTRFLEPEKYALLSESTMSANITGVGVEMAYSDDGGIVVVAPTPGGPADEACVKPNDLIVAVDGRTVEGLSLYEVADQLQGPATSKVTISLQRDGNKSELIETSVTRRKYALVPVRSMVCDSDSVTNKKINYIRLTTFNQLSGSRVKEAVRSGAADGANAVVLDLRSNSGGLFPGALDIAKTFMNKGPIVLIADSDGVRDVFEADGTALAPDVPLTVLVDKGTASASEVLAGALRDNKRATILGDTETFGKGLIQTVVPLADGSAVSVTVARYQTPSGADINKVGITPDGKLPTVRTGDGDGETKTLPSEPGAFCAALVQDTTVAGKLFT